MGKGEESFQVMEWPVRERPWPFAETSGSPKAVGGIDGWLCRLCFLSQSAASPCLLQEAGKLAGIFFSKAARGALSLLSGNLYIARHRQTVHCLRLMSCCQTFRWNRSGACSGSGGREAHLLGRLSSPHTSLYKELWEEEGMVEWVVRSWCVQGSTFPQLLVLSFLLGVIAISFTDEKAEVWSGFIGYLLVLHLLFMLLKLTIDPSLETDLPLLNTLVTRF